MSLGTYFAYRLDPLLMAFKAFFSFVLLFFLISSIFNSVWASMINQKMLKNLGDLKILINVVISASVLGFGFIFIFLSLLGMIYIMDVPPIHLIMFIISIGSMIGHIVMLGLSISYSNSNKTSTYLVIMKQLITSNSTIVADWKNLNGCETLKCYPKVDTYINDKIRIGFVFNIVMISLILLSFLGFVIVIILMGIIQPVNRNEEENTNTNKQDEYSLEDIESKEPEKPNMQQNNEPKTQYNISKQKLKSEAMITNFGEFHIAFRDHIKEARRNSII